jgi:hypothetical protein
MAQTGNLEDFQRERTTVHGSQVFLAHWAFSAFEFFRDSVAFLFDAFALFRCPLDESLFFLEKRMWVRKTKLAILKPLRVDRDRRGSV